MALFLNSVWTILFCTVCCIKPIKYIRKLRPLIDKIWKGKTVTMCWFAQARIWFYGIVCVTQLKIALSGFRELQGIGSFLTVYKAFNVREFYCGGQSRSGLISLPFRCCWNVQQKCVKVNYKLAPQYMRHVSLVICSIVLIQAYVVFDLCLNKNINNTISKRSIIEIQRTGALDVEIFPHTCCRLVCWCYLFLDQQVW